MKKQSGVLKSWDDVRGFGFITDKKGRDIFVHVSAFGRIRSRPKAGEKVLFRVEPDAAKGVRAVEVERCWRPAHLLLPEFLFPLMMVGAFYGVLWWFFSQNAFWIFLIIFLLLIAGQAGGAERTTAGAGKYPAAFIPGRRLARRPVGPSVVSSQNPQAAFSHCFLVGGRGKSCGVGLLSVQSPGSALA